MIILKKNIGVIIADDHLLVRQGLKNLLEMQEGIKILDEAVDGVEAVEKTLEINPDILLLDINMPKMNGIEVLTKIKKENPNQKIIILSIHNTREYVEESIRRGADGYVSKNADILILTDAIVRVHQGQTYIQPTLIKSLIDSELNKKTAKENPEPIGCAKLVCTKVGCAKLELDKLLTSREIEVLRGIVDGKSNKEIGKALSISEKTVRNHLYNIFKKLGVSDRTQAAVVAIKNNIINND